MNILEGLQGVLAVVTSGGRVVLEDGSLNGTEGSGPFLPRKAFSDVVYKRIRARSKVTTLVSRLLEIHRTEEFSQNYPHCWVKVQTLGS